MHAYSSDTFIIPLGSTVFAEIQGVIDACIKLSGMPDLSLSFMVSFALFCNSFVPNIYEVLNEMINTDTCFFQITLDYVRSIPSTASKDSSLHDEHCLYG